MAGISTEHGFLFTCYVNDTIRDERKISWSTSVSKTEERGKERDGFQVALPGGTVVSPDVKGHTRLAHAHLLWCSGTDGPAGERLQLCGPAGRRKPAFKVLCVRPGEAIFHSHHDHAWPVVL